jgi:hypothetical protein
MWRSSAAAQAKVYPDGTSCIFSRYHTDTGHSRQLSSRNDFRPIRILIFFKLYGSTVVTSDNSVIE